MNGMETRRGGHSQRIQTQFPGTHAKPKIAVQPAMQTGPGQPVESIGGPLIGRQTSSSFRLASVRAADNRSRQRIRGKITNASVLNPETEDEIPNNHQNSSQNPPWNLEAGCAHDSLAIWAPSVPRIDDLGAWKGLSTLLAVTVFGRHKETPRNLNHSLCF